MTVGGGVGGASGGGGFDGAGGAAGGGAGNDGGTASGGSFGYGRRSLDELRALASSVDTSRIADAQTDFARIAREMDDVVTQLVAMRGQIPSWWRGASADEAVAKFGQVVEHAQTAFAMADGAERALSTCVNVVAEQQAAMGNVPEVSEPKSGLASGQFFGAAPMVAQLGAFAGEEQRYEAARGRAVEVVNGIAAQFVETTAQLRGLNMTKYDTSFRISPGGESAPESPNIDKGIASPKEQRYVSAIQQNVNLPSYQRSHNSTKSSYTTNASTTGESLAILRDEPKNIAPLTMSKQHTGAAETGLLEPPRHQQGPAADYSVIEVSPKLNTLTASSSPTSSIESHRDLAAESSSTRLNSKREPYLRLEGGGKIHPSSGSNQFPYQLEDIENHQRGDSIARDYLNGPDSLDPGVGEAGLYLPQVPIHGSSPNYNRNERSRRPDYLREPKEVWLPDQIVAPSDGLMTPDWELRICSVES